MDFIYLGSNCSVLNCKQQDYLPFICEACKEKFCVEHRSFREHSCKKAPEGDVVFICPVCSQGISLIQGEDLNITWENHRFHGNCMKILKPRCANPKCKTRLTDINAVDCKRCHQKTCLQHRYTDMHDCMHPLERKNTSSLKIR